MADLKAQVTDWISELGRDVGEEDDPETNWHLTIEYPDGSGKKMHVVQPKGKDRGVVIATTTNFSPKHVKAFDALPKDEQRAFQLAFRRNLNRIEIEYQVQGSEGPHDCPESFQVSAVRFDDGLNLDSFARAVGAVYKVKLDAILFIHERLDGREPGTGGRFDFERLGP